MSEAECGICKNGVIWACECIENIKAGKTFDGKDIAIDNDGFESGKEGWAEYTEIAQQVKSTKPKNTCPDCAIRVDTYIKSIEEHRAALDKLRADLEVAKSTLSQIGAEGWQTSEISDNKDFIFIQTLAREALAKLESKE